MANNTGTLVGAPIRPWSPDSVFASALADELQGGLHVVQTDASRNALPSWYLEDGMLVVVLASAEAGGNKATYQYDVSSWITFGVNNASLNDLYDSIIRIDASLNNVTDGASIFLLNASIGTGFSWNGGTHQIDVSIGSSLAAYATNASIGTAAFAKNASLSLYVKKAGDTMTGNLTIDTSLSVHEIYVPLNDDIFIKAGNTNTGTDPGNLYLIAGNNNSLTTGAGGAVYISPGREYSSGGTHSTGMVYIGNPSYNYTEVGIAPSGGSSYIDLHFSAKGSGTIYLGSSSTSDTVIYGDLHVSNGGTSIFQLLTSGPYGPYFLLNASNNTIESGAGASDSSYNGKNLVIKAGNGDSGSGFRGNGGNLTLQAGNAASNSSPNIGGDLILGAGKGIMGGSDGKLYLRYIPSASASKVLYYNPDTSILSYGDPSGGTGVSSLLALTDVSIVSIGDKNLLQYDLASAKWKNVAPLDGSAYFQKKLTYTTIPGTSTTGTMGDMVYDASYLYLCTSTNKWGRLLLSYAF